MVAPSISVILPTRGRSPHFEQALASALDADPGSGFAVIVAHDRRTGEPRLEGVAAGEGRVSVVEATRPGPAAARNAGIGAAGGELLAFLDDDDLWLPGHLRRARATLAGDPAAALVASDAYLMSDVSPDGALAPPPDPAVLPRFAPNVAGGRIELRELLLANPILTPTVVLRRSALPRLSCFDEDLSVMEDYALWLELGRSAPLCFDREPSVIVRRRPTSASHDHRQMAACSLAILARLDAEGLLARELDSGERRHRLGGLWHDLGWAELFAGDAREARRALLRAIACEPARFKSYAYLAIALLPAALRRTLPTQRAASQQPVARRRGAAPQS